MDKEIDVPILKELGQMYIDLYNADKQMQGSTFIVQKKRFEELKTALNIAPDNDKNITFMNVNVVCSDVEAGTDEIVFVENTLNIGEDNDRKELLQNAHSQLAEKISEEVRQRKIKVIEALKNVGITFADDEAFTQFAKSQLEAEEIDGVQVVKYNGKILIEFKPKQ